MRAASFASSSVVLFGCFVVVLLVCSSLGLVCHAVCRVPMVFVVVVSPVVFLLVGAGSSWSGTNYKVVECGDGSVCV